VNGHIDYVFDGEDEYKYFICTKNDDEKFVDENGCCDFYKEKQNENFGGGIGRRRGQAVGYSLSERKRIVSWLLPCKVQILARRNNRRGING